MTGKFNLTQLLNQRSKEVQVTALEEEQQEAKEIQEAQEKGEIVMMDVYNLIPSKDNFYHVDDGLKQSIELVGVLQPLLIKKPENGKCLVIAGHNRRLASITLVEEGKEEYRYVPCVYKKENIRDRTALIMANRFREKTDWEKMNEAIEAEELAKELKEEHKLKGKTREILAELTGITEAQLGRYHAIYNNLHPLLMEEFKENRINVSVANEVCGLAEEWQQQAAEIFMENGILTLPDVKELKKQEEAAGQITGQMNINDVEQGQEEQPEEETPEEEPEDGTGEETGQEEPERTEDFEPQPDTVTALCYSCEHYEECHEKKSTVTSCNQYLNRSEARKTDEQRYNEEQAAIDRETKKKLQEQEDEKKTQQLTGEKEPKQHDIRLATSRYEEIISGKLLFLLLKKDGYKVGEEIVLPEYMDGKETGRTIDIAIMYVWEDWAGLDEEYCIIGFTVQAWQ